MAEGKSAHRLTFPIGLLTLPNDVLAETVKAWCALNLAREADAVYLENGSGGAEDPDNLRTTYETLRYKGIYIDDLSEDDWEGQLLAQAFCWNIWGRKEAWDFMLDGLPGSQPRTPPRTIVTGDSVPLFRFDSFAEAAEQGRQGEDAIALWEQAVGKPCRHFTTVNARIMYEVIEGRLDPNIMRFTAAVYAGLGKTSVSPAKPLDMLNLLRYLAAGFSKAEQYERWEAARFTPHVPLLTENQLRRLRKAAEAEQHFRSHRKGRARWYAPRRVSADLLCLTVERRKRTHDRNEAERDTASARYSMSTLSARQAHVEGTPSARPQHAESTPNILTDQPSYPNPTGEPEAARPPSESNGELQAERRRRAAAAAHHQQMQAEAERAAEERRRLLNERAAISRAAEEAEERRQAEVAQRKREAADERRRGQGIPLPPTDTHVER